MIKTLSPIFIVDDVNETIEFYQKNFDLTITHIYPDGETNDFAILQNENIEIMFQSRENANRELHVIGTKKSPCNNSVLYLEVDNIEPYFDRVENKVTIISPIKTTNYHTKEFTFMDNNGIVITLGEMRPTND